MLKCSLGVMCWLLYIQILFRLEVLKILFLILGVCTAALGLMILFVGCLATGATRQRVYRAWQARVSGRISCAVVSSQQF